MNVVAVPSTVSVIGVTWPPVPRMPAIAAYALPTSVSPPVRATESASWENVCAARAASPSASSGAVLSLPQGSYVAVATLRSTNFPVQERVAFDLR